jgi:hypothetical protein
LERVLIVAVILIVLSGLGLAWRWYKGQLARSIGIEEAAGQPTLLYFTADYCAPEERLPSFAALPGRRRTLPSDHKARRRK